MGKIRRRVYVGTKMYNIRPVPVGGRVNVPDVVKFSERILD